LEKNRKEWKKRNFPNQGNLPKTFPGKKGSPNLEGEENFKKIPK